MLCDRCGMREYNCFCTPEEIRIHAMEPEIAKLQSTVARVMAHDPPSGGIGDLHAENAVLRSRLREAVEVLRDLCGWDWSRLLVHHPDSDTIREQVEQADKWLETNKGKS